MKKVLSLALVMVLVLGMSVTSFAAISVSKEEGTGFSKIAPEGQYVNLGDSVAPGFTKTYPIATGAFKITGDENNENDKSILDGVAANGGYTKKALPKVVVRTRIAKGSNVIDKIDITYDKATKLAQLEVKFVKPFKNNNTDGQEFDIWVFPVVDGSTMKYEEKGINFVGTLKNGTVTVDAQTDFADLYNGDIAKFDANVRNVKFDLGSDVSIIGKGYKGQKFWGIANQDVSEADLENMSKYDIAAVYHLSVLGGLDKAANNVEIANLTKEDYVFDGSLKFLGMGDAKNIPFAETYYVADKMIEVASEEEPADTATEGDLDPLALPPVTGGDSSAPAGIFDNPSTGA